MAGRRSHRRSGAKAAVALACLGALCAAHKVLPASRAAVNGVAAARRAGPRTCSIEAVALPSPVIDRRREILRQTRRSTPSPARPPVADSAAVVTGKVVPVPVTPSAEVQELVKGAVVAGEYMLNQPNILRGISSDGEMTRALPLLGQEEELELIRQAWFFVAAADALREQRGDAADADGDGASHEQLLRHMREQATARGGVGAKPAAGAAGAAGSMGELCEQLPSAMSDTEFRLKEAVGRGAYNKLFLHNQGLVHHEVHKLFPNFRQATVMERADLLQEGAQGLLRAIRLFDPARGCRFATYASWHVRSHVLRAVRDKLNVVRLPQNLQQDMTQIRRARYRYSVDNQGLAPGARELAATLQWPTARVEKALAETARSAVSLDEATGTSNAAGDTGPQPLMNILVNIDQDARHGSAASENALYQQQLRATLTHAMRERDPRRVALIRLRYGLDDGREWSYPQLGARFNMTASAAKGLVYQELKFLRTQRRQVLQHFRYT